MPSLSLVGPTYQSESLSADAQLCLNMYPEILDSKAPGGSAKAALYPTPGKYVLCTMGGGPGACIVPADTYVFPDNTTPAAFLVNGTQLSYITIGVSGGLFTATEVAIGTVSSKALGSGLFPAQIIVINPKLLFVVANGKAFIAAFGSPISSSALNQGGLGYAVGDTGIVQGGNGIDAFYTVNTVDVNGAVLTYTISPAGVGYVVATGAGTLAFGTQPGIGTGFTIDITGVGAAAWVVQQEAIPATDTAFNNYVNSATFMDGYVIVTMAPNSVEPLRRQFFISGLNDPSFWDPLAVEEKEGNPDPLVAGFAAYEMFGAFGTQTTELYYNSGNPNLVFSRIAGGGVIENGLASPWAICKSDGTVTWLGTDTRGSNVAWQLRGMTPVRISNHAIEDAWRNYDSSGASCYSYQENGHFFVVFTFPIADTTWVYDSTTQMWHRRARGASGAFPSDSGRYHAFVQGVGHILQDPLSGKVYLANAEFIDDAGVAINRIRRTPHSRDELKRILYQHVRLLIDQGGATNLAPWQISLRLSDDGGHTWGPYLTLTVGGPGIYKQLVEWFHLGYARDRVFEISSNASVFQAWVEGYASFTESLNQI